MNSDDFYEFEDRAYVQPTVTRDESLAFANTLRGIQAQNNAQIASQTANLGTDVPSNLGGLAGSGSYFEQRYQTTPIETQVNTLKSAAQAQALNDLMNNYQSQMKTRYNRAYRNAQARANRGGGGGGGGDGAEGEYNQGEGETGTVEYPGTMPMGSDIWGNRNVTMYEDINTNYRIYKDANTGEILQVLNAENKPVDQEKDPYYRIMSDGMFHRVDSPEYRKAESQARQNKFWSDLTTALWAPGYAIGQGVGEWIRGK